jgi:REP element-mobilizing transposase RayT
MPISENDPKRKSLRLADHDYSQPGFYFITLCTYCRMPFLGSWEEGELLLNPPGNMVETCWKNLPDHFPHVRLDAYQIMPDHFHGVIELTGSAGAPDRAPLPKIIQGYKSVTTHAYMGWIKALDPSFPKPLLWQRNYYEHVIRNQARLDKIRQYIQANPKQTNI